MKVGGQSAWWTLKTVMVQHVREAFQEPSRVEAQWRELDFSSRPDFEAAIREYEDFLGQLKGEDVEVVFQDHDPDCTLDALYAHDASLVTDGGIVLASMGKALRRPEVDAMAVTCERLGFPVLGRIEPPGLLEAGDVAWLGPRSVAVGQGYRTNPEGLRQLRELLGDRVDEVIPVPLPHWRGREEVLHLLSIISVVDRDLAVVDLPLMPVPFVALLEERGFQLVSIPEEERDTLGCNVLALGPRRCLVVEGNPVTRARLEEAGCHVRVYRGDEISLKGTGGPTCLTRPLLRVPEG